MPKFCIGSGRFLYHSKYLNEDCPHELPIIKVRTTTDDIPDRVHLRFRTELGYSVGNAIIDKISDMHPQISYLHVPVWASKHGYSIIIIRYLTETYPGMQITASAYTACVYYIRKKILNEFNIGIVDYPDLPKIEASPRNCDNTNALSDGKSIELVFTDPESSSNIGIGCINFTNDDHPFLYNFYINPEVRGKGYGHAAMQYMIDRYHISVLSVLSDNGPAIRLYESFGFHVGYSYVDHGSHLLCMVR